MDDFPNAGELSKADKVAIRNFAIEKGFIPDVSINVVMDTNGKIYRYADFKWLDDKIRGRSEGYTWHHSEIDGQMELVPTGIHNVYNHNGGRTKNHWAYRKGGR